VYVHIDGAHQRWIGEAEIDRPAQGIDVPIVKAVLSAAGAGSAKSHA